jgi:hypothetical protein
MSKENLNPGPPSYAMMQVFRRMIVRDADGLLLQGFKNTLHFHNISAP